MEWLLVALPAVACAAMMLAVCGPMMFGRKHACSDDKASKQEINELRDELARLRTDRPINSAGSRPAAVVTGRRDEVRL